jgi:peptide maturation system protein (TIGR04066 family)
MYKSKTVIYPCDKQNVSVVIKFAQEYCSKSLLTVVVPQSWALEGSDLSRLDNRYQTGIVITNDFENALCQCEEVFILESIYHTLIYDNVLENIEIAMKKGCDVNCSFALKEYDAERFQVYAKEKNVGFTYFSAENLLRQEMSLEDIEVPIVYIGDLYTYAHTTDVLITLTEGLEEHGYKVTSIFKNRNCNLLGYEIIPDFFTQTNINETQKTIKLNQFVNQIATEQQPDIMLIEYCEPLMMYTKRVTSSLGILPILQSIAVEPDYLVLCITMAECGQALIDLIDQYTSKKIGRKADMVLISNNEVDYNSRVSAQRLAAFQRQVSKRSPPNRTYTSQRIRLSRSQSNFPACNRSWQDIHSAIVLRLRPIMARSHATLPFKSFSFLTW